MFSGNLVRGAGARFRSWHQAVRCDDAVTQADDGGFGDTGSFETDGGDMGKEVGRKVATPFLFENLVNTLRQSAVNNYDGFRVIVQKQVNLNTVASHFYWIGSQTAPPIYQYRIILPFEDKQINVATDMDFNIEGELRVPMGKGLSAKTSFSIHEQNGNNLSMDVDLIDDSSATQLVYSPNGNVINLSYMQSLTKSLILGGQGEYVGNKNAINLSFGGVYDDQENVLGFQWDSSVRSFSCSCSSLSICVSLCACVCGRLFFLHCFASISSLPVHKVQYSAYVSPLSCFPVAIGLIRYANNNSGSSIVWVRVLFSRPYPWRRAEID